MIWDRKYIHFFGMAFEALPEEKKRLGLLCLGALLVHLLAFAFLRISYPQSVVLLGQRTQARVFAQDPNTSSNSSPKVFWYEMKDPSLVIRARNDLFDLASSVPEIRPRWVPTPGEARVILPLTEDYEFLPDRLPPLGERVATTLTPPRVRFDYPVSDMAAMANHSVVQWDDVLLSRAAGMDWKLPAVSAELLVQSRTTVLRMAVNALGKVEHVLLEQSCGKSEIDQVAIDSARQIALKPLAPGISGLVWGRATVYWQFTASPLPAASKPPSGERAQ